MSETVLVTYATRYGSTKEVAEKIDVLAKIISEQREKSIPVLVKKLESNFISYFNC